MNVNLSDLAAMGDVKPLFALVGIALPKDTSVEFVEGLYRGMNRSAVKYGFAIAGGDTVSSKSGIVLSVTLLGSAKSENILTRSGAKPGDLVAVTGNFGDSGAGLRLLGKMHKTPGSFDKYLINKHLVPVPRFEAAKHIAKYGSSLIDSSDGLHASVRFIAQSSKTGAEIDIEKLPISRQLLDAAKKHNYIDPVTEALYGGEDYELVFTLHPKNAAKLKGKIKFTVIGTIVKGKRVEYLINGKPYKKNAKGFEHFS